MSEFTDAAMLVDEALGCEEELLCDLQENCSFDILRFSTRLFFDDLFGCRGGSFAGAVAGAY